MRHGRDRCDDRVRRRSAYPKAVSPPCGDLLRSRRGNGNAPVRAPQRAARRAPARRDRHAATYPDVANLRSLSVAEDRPCLRVPQGYFTGENRDLMALDQARCVLERLRRIRSSVRERVRQCSCRFGLEVRQNVPLGSRRHPSWAFRRAGHLVRVAHRRVAHRSRDPAGDPEGTGAPLPITRFA
jgi:hypothetical protein